ncbi:MAG TPA: DUF3450 family protein, partial [Gammaproteobacteria bacterium]
FIKLDLPYRQDERLAKVVQLKTLISNGGVAVTDKFQKLVQAYDDEIAAGRTVEAFRGQVSENGKSLTVNFLRVGHVLLAYQTLDRSETGYWDKQAHKWRWTTATRARWRMPSPSPTRRRHPTSWNCRSRRRR